MLMLFILMTMVVIVMVVLLNPDYWQGYRNSKFIDEQFEFDMDMDDRIKGETNEETNELRHSTNTRRKD